MKKYKRKFLVEGETIYECRHFYRKCLEKYGDDPPCTVWVNTISGRKVRAFRRDLSKCPFPIGKPKTYVVSLTEDGEWECSCKAWTTRVPRRDCKHIKKVKEDPEKYEVSTEWSAKKVQVLRRVLNG